MYSSLAPDGFLKLYLGSLILSFGYTILVSAACIRAGTQEHLCCA
jgi:hypothetical protein